MSDQISFQGIHVHVLQFLDKLRLTPDVKVVEAGLPELGQDVRIAKRKSELWRGNCLAWRAAYPPRNSLLQDLHDGGWSTLGGFADEQVNVIGHDNVASQGEPIPVAHLAQNLHEQILRAG